MLGKEGKPGSAAEEVFLAALELSPPERASYIHSACGTDAQLRKRVEALLRAHDAPEGFLPERPESPPEDINISGLAAPLAEQPGDLIGRYKLLQKIGEGGCGIVYLAEQEDLGHRKVALKVIKLGMDTRQVVARFEAERQALAMMDHPNIARVLDAGATDAGRPYFVMELVDGIKITDYCAHNRLGARERLEVFMQVCRAIQHAHQKGVIHRDIKPSNVLVTTHDDLPVPKVIDFGIAKATQGRLVDQTVFTAFAQFLGTPAYMSPEQAELGGVDVDARSDIYSLGVLLYELLTGKTPFDVRELLATGLETMRRTIQEKEPPTPSTRVAQELKTLNEAGRVATSDGAPAASSVNSASTLNNQDLRDLIRLLRGDLDWIVMKCLEKDRARRYESANGLAMDIQRHLNNEPVLASPPGNLYRFQKLMRRNKNALAAATLVITALVAGIMGSKWHAILATKAKPHAFNEKVRADAEAGKKEVTNRFLNEMPAPANPYESSERNQAKGANLTMQEQDFEKSGAGWSYSTAYWNFCVSNPPPPAVVSDPSGSHFMRLAYNRVTDQVNGIAFDTFTGDVGSIELSFEFRMGGGTSNGDPSPGGDGMGVVLLNTTRRTYFGTPGIVPWPWSNTPDGGLAEEPNVVGSIGVGLDTCQNADIGDANNNHVSLHFNGTRLKAAEIDPAKLNLEDNAWHSAVLKVDVMTGSVQFSIDGTTYIDEVLFGLSPCVRLRPAFYARTAGAYNDHDLDNIHAEFHTILNIAEIRHLEASPAILWPANHNMVEVAIDYSLDFGCQLESDISTTITVTSNEPAFGQGDMEVVDAHHVRLRAERSEEGSGRIYFITLTCADKGGRVVSRGVSVSVPRAN